MKNTKKRVLLLFVILVAITVIGIPGLYVISKYQNPDVILASDDNIPVYDIKDIPNLIVSTEAIVETETETEPPTSVFEEYDIKLLAVGDNLFHMGVVNTGKQSDGSLDYACLYEGIKPYLENTDIKIINQETILGGNERGFSGYPHFNSPTQVGDSLSKVGFNVVLHSSNHSADQGVAGMDSCISFWQTHPEVHMTGIHNPDEEDMIIMEIQDYKFAILNYTYGPNYEIVSKPVISRLNLLCNFDPNSGKLDFTTINPKVLEDIKKAKEVADIVIVCPHWGTEYQTKPSSYQETFARQMTEAGADLIIGTHPHVVQPVEWITTENGNTSLCYYSLGNYVSTQKNGCSMLEGLAWVDFHVTEDGISISKEKSGIVPLVCHYSYGPIRIKYVYPLEEYTEELASHHGIKSYGGISFHLSDLEKWSNEILGDSVISNHTIFEQ